VNEGCLPNAYAAVDRNAPYHALDDETRTALSGLWDSDRSDDEIEEEYDERLTALGL